MTHDAFEFVGSVAYVKDGAEMADVFGGNACSAFIYYPYNVTGAVHVDPVIVKVIILTNGEAQAVMDGGAKEHRKHFGTDNFSGSVAATSAGHAKRVVHVD